MANSYFFDPEFQDKLIAHIVRDRHLLKEVSHYLSPDDFKPNPKGPADGWERWVVAGLAYSYYRKYHQPLKGLLRTEILDYCRKNGAGAKQRKKLLSFAKRIRKLSLEAGPALRDKVLTFKQERLKSQALEEMIEKLQLGELDNKEWVRLSREGVEGKVTGRYDIRDFFKVQELERRTNRRLLESEEVRPPFLIEPLDNLTQNIARGEIGLWMAPLKRGKSLALEHMALAYCFQGFSVLYVTCEDPIDEVENRLDGSISALPLDKLRERPNTLRRRFLRYRSFFRSTLKLVDATEGQCSIEFLESLLEDERDQGNLVDVLIIDYDNEIKCTRNFKGDNVRRFEFAEIYKGLRQLASRWKVFLWTASQSQRGTKDKKIITSDHVAEDISKMQKITLAITVGKYDSSGDTFFLYIAANKNGPGEIGCPIRHRKKAGMFYDRERTIRAMMDGEFEEKDPEPEDDDATD